MFEHENTILKLFKGEYLFLGESTYLLVNNYWGVRFSGEYLLTVGPVDFALHGYENP